jgi:biopolymer transport protein ExbB/TolQ
MFKALEGLETGVSPALIASGIKVSMICLIYGLLIYIISLLFLFFKK